MFDKGQYKMLLARLSLPSSCMYTVDGAHWIGAIPVGLVWLVALVPPRDV